MTPQIVAVVLKFFWDQYQTQEAKPTRGRKKATASRGGNRMKLLALVVTLLAALGYIKSDKLSDLIKGKITAVEETLGGAGTSSAGDGPIRVYFTAPPGNPADARDIAHACVGYIDAVKRTLDVAGFEIDNKVIIAALVRAKQRGVAVRVATDTDYLDETAPLTAAGIPVVDDKRSALMHDKFMVFDGAAVWTGSMNFTENCAYKNNNNGVYLAVPELAANYATKFKWMFEDKLFGKKPKHEAIPHPQVKLADGTVLENYFAPHDECADRLIGLVAQSRKALDFLAFSFTHDGIGRAVAARAQAGVAVRGVFEKTQMASGHSEYARLRGLGLPVYPDANPRNMHHKVMVLDGATTVTGSFNFSESADRSNDENLLFIRNNAAVAGLFTAEVGRVFDAAKAANPGP